MSLNIDIGSDEQPAPVKPSRQKPSSINPSFRGIRFVIFPENRWGQAWDFIMIIVIWYYSFYIPFHICVSGGYFYSQDNKGFRVFNTIVNAFFFGKFSAWLWYKFFT